LAKHSVGCHWQVEKRLQEREWLLDTAPANLLQVLFLFSG
jgi:hypothetical protein